MNRYIKYQQELNRPDKVAKIVYACFFIVLGAIIAVLGTYVNIVE